MLIWDITAPGHGGFSLTDRTAAERIRDILSGGALYPGGAVSLDYRRAPKSDAPTPVATVREGGSEVHDAIHEAVEAVRSLNAKEAADYVQTLNSRDVLVAVKVSEEAHPRYTGGRHDVLNAIEERDGEIDLGDPNI